MTTKFVYSLSSKPYPNRMVKDAIRSIESLKNWVNPKNVEIFYTPPHETEDIKKLRKTGAKVNVIESELPEFRLNFLEKKYGYGEMWNLCRVQSENVVWLDTDTIITKDIWDIVEGDFDFKAYPEESPDSQSWRDMFKRNGSSPMGWMINSGFVIFKNNIHREIKEQWKNLLTSDLGYYQDPLKQDAYSLQISVSDYNTKRMDEKDHILEWKSTEANGYVYHYITGDDISSQIRGILKRRTPEFIHRKWREHASKKIDERSQ